MHRACRYAPQHSTAVRGALLCRGRLEEIILVFSHSTLSTITRRLFPLFVSSPHTTLYPKHPSQWSTATYGTHLLDYERDTRVDLIESLWREAQHSVRAVGNMFMVDKPFAHPFHLCGWGLGKRYYKAWAQQFFLPEPNSVVHDVSMPEFSSFSLFPVSVCWTPDPKHGDAEYVGAVRSASPVEPLQAGDLGRAFNKVVHETTIQCHTCDEVVRLEETHGEAQARPHLGAERLDIIRNVFDDSNGRFE